MRSVQATPETVTLLVTRIRRTEDDMEDMMVTVLWL